jgi:hypothetical protein
MASDEILVAKETFTTELDGSPVVVQKGRTRVRAGHPLTEGREELFEPVELEVHYDVEQATAAPGEKRGATSSSSGSESAAKSRGKGKTAASDK